MIRAAFLSLLLVSTVSAQVPIDQEPHHKLILENEYVRVFEVNLAPGEATLLHQHDRGYIVVTLGDAKITNERKGEDPKQWEFPDGDARFVQGGYSHQARNSGEFAYRNITVELKRDTGKVECVATSTPCKTVGGIAGGTAPTQEIQARAFSIHTVLQSENVKVELVRIAPQGETSDHYHCGPHAAVLLDDVTLANLVDNRTVSQINGKRAGVQWITSTKQHRLRNEGEDDVRYVVVEFNESCKE